MFVGWRIVVERVVRSTGRNSRPGSPFPVLVGDVGGLVQRARQARRVLFRVGSFVLPLVRGGWTFVDSRPRFVIGADRVACGYVIDLECVCFCGLVHAKVVFRRFPFVGDRYGPVAVVAGEVGVLSLWQAPNFVGAVLFGFVHVSVVSGGSSPPYAGPSVAVETCRGAVQDFYFGVLFINCFVGVGFLVLVTGGSLVEGRGPGVAGEVHRGVECPVVRVRPFLYFRVRYHRCVRNEVVAVSSSVHSCPWLAFLVFGRDEGVVISNASCVIVAIRLCGEDSVGAIRAVFYAGPRGPMAVLGSDLRVAL